jgi:hypothetical protein
MKGMGAEADKKCWTEGRVMKENERKFEKAGGVGGVLYVQDQGEQRKCHSLVIHL